MERIGTDTLHFSCRYDTLALPPGALSPQATERAVQACSAYTLSVLASLSRLPAKFSSPVFTDGIFAYSRVSESNYGCDTPQDPNGPPMQGEDEKEKEITIMSSKNSNKLNVPEARAAMDKFKMEAASEVGVNLKNGYNGDLTSREAGSVGGQMVKKMIESYEKNL